MIPLHVHSYYSFLEGTAAIENLISKAKEYNLTSLALTDTNAMHGLISFTKQANEAGIKSILGTYVDDPNNKELYAVLLAKNIKGYESICKIITTRNLKKDFSLINLLQSYFPDFFIVIHSLELLQSIPIYDNIYAELISTRARKKKTRILYEYAQSKKIKCIAANPIYFLNSKDYIIHKTVTAIKNRSTLQNLNQQDLVDEEFYFKDPKQLKHLWRSFPEVIKNNEYIANNCEVDLKIGDYKFPVYPSTNNENSFSLLWKLCSEGLNYRYSIITDNIMERLKNELAVIDELHLSDYFLVVWDILNEAKKRRMMTIGRGSAANSIVSYCLGFTEVDPIKYNLYFERFLNRGRLSPPDIDIDFSWKERDEIVKYVFNKYGYDHVAFISTHVTFKARSALRETAKIFGISDREISQISKYIPHTNAHNLSKISQLFPESKSVKFDDELWKNIVNISIQLAGFPRHLSIHPGGIVIAPSPITKYTALEYAENKGVGLIITQPDMYGIEDLGLVKIDLLSQRSLGVLRDTMIQLENNNHEDLI